MTSEPHRRQALQIAVALLLAGALAACARQNGAEGAGAQRPLETAATTAQTSPVEDLPYLTWVPTRNPSGRGVVRFDRARAAPGLNLYAPRNRAAAFLIDNAGSVLHAWHQDGVPDGWHHVEPVADGGLLAIVKDQELVALDWQSNILWRYEARVHHDVAPEADGSLWVASRRERTVESGGERTPILDDLLVELDPEHRVRRTLSVFDLFRSEIAVSRFEEIRSWIREEQRKSPGTSRPTLDEGTPADLFHLNSVELVERDVPGVARRGDLLISLRGIDRVAFVDPSAPAVRWSWGPGVIEGQHHPSLLANGDLLMFDNGIRRRFSRVVEVDPRRERLVWEYSGGASAGFYSYTRGAAQRLLNGDTLVTDSDNGRAFEVTPAGAMVWEFLCPEIQVNAESSQPERAALYRVRRLETGELRSLGIAHRLGDVAP